MVVISSREALQPGDVLTNNELKRMFQVGQSGGMRKSNATNSLVLVCNHVESLYDDVWQGNVLHYTGMGQVGDQDPNWLSNKTLTHSPTNGVTLHLFEVFTAKQYTYQGQVELAAAPTTAQQLDSQQQLRRVCVFPLRLKAGEPRQLEATQARDFFLDKVKRKNRLLSDAQLEQIARKQQPARPATSTVERVVYSRDPDIVVYALRRAQGKCELCAQPAPFLTREGLPFLEVHHIDYLAHGGSDTVKNVAALCPNCHRRMHALAKPADIVRLKLQAQRPIGTGSR
jgi:5-methylcytosine-specific restriction protein A